LRAVAQTINFVSEPRTLRPSQNDAKSPIVIPTYQPVFLTISSLSSNYPSGILTFHPSKDPTVHPTFIPFTLPTTYPSEIPTAVPSVEPTAHPTLPPTEKPTAIPTYAPTKMPTVQPSMEPTSNPTIPMIIYAIDSTIFVVLFFILTFLFWVFAAPTHDSYVYPSSSSQRMLHQVSLSCYYCADLIIQPLICNCINPIIRGQYENIHSDSDSSGFEMEQI
jgi:hypothetical protein